jgi:hypothetical protein
MPVALRERLCCAHKPLLGLDHVAAGETVRAAAVLAECDQVRRAAHRAHHMVKLLFPITMPMREHRQVAGRECRLIAGDRVEGEAGLGDDFLAVGPRNLSVLVDALELKPFRRHA